MSDNNTLPYKDTSLSFSERARDLVFRMTIEEKVSQMLNKAPAVDRLDIPAYDWWSECLHGVARAGIATVFPQAIGLAAMWNVDLMHRIATVISDEARAKHHEAAKKNDRQIYRGLTFWSPNINIFRDPRWGRGHETFGEDPYLTARTGVAFVKGLQGDDPKYLKLVATPKHYAVHSGPEEKRHYFDARVSQKDLWETYLPAFQACVVEGKAGSVMGAYSRANGEPCCASKTLLIDILRDKWGFDGYVVSDCGAIQDIHAEHKVTSCTAESAALSIRNGCDLECGCVYASLLTAVERGMITVEEIDRALIRLFEARFKLGMFDPAEMVPYAQIPYEINDCEKHRELAAESARQSVVLLKNDGVLPLNKNLKSIAVIGPNAQSLEVLLGNYNGMPSVYTDVLDGIRGKLSHDARLWYAKGCELMGERTRGFSEAVSAAERSEVVVMVLGLAPSLEGEQGEAKHEGTGADRPSIDLTGPQQKLLETIAAVGKPVVLVLVSGSALAVNWAQDNVQAVVQAFYPGEEGGTGVADVLFGDYNPAGRLPVTVMRLNEHLPPIEDYAMKGRTYRYAEHEPLYPFGFGLSFTRFEYSDLKLSTSVKAGDTLEVTATIKNAGDRAGDEVVQAYLTDLEASVDVPIRALVGFKRISLPPGESRAVSFNIAPEQMAIIDNNGNSVLEPGEFKISVGGSQGDARSLELGAAPVLTATFKMTDS